MWISSSRRCATPKRRPSTLVSGVVLSLVAGCKGGPPYVAPTGPMPPNTVLLSEMMQALSAKPGFTEAMLAQLDTGGKNGPALLTPKLVHRMREMILGSDWAGLNRFPGWTMREINPTVRVVGHVVGKDDKLESLAKDAGPSSGKASGPRTPTPTQLSGYVDLDALVTDKAVTVDLDQPSKLPGFSAEGLVTPLDYGVIRGDGADPLIAPMHSESARLAAVLNRLALNGVDGVAPARASLSGMTAETPEQLVQMLGVTGHTVTVADARYFANFGHFHYNGQDVMMPFWVNPQIRVPGTDRPLMVPVSHTEYEWFVRGPKVNADVAFYFGIDGKAEFRTMDELNQPWVLGRHAHEYNGVDGVEVTRLTGAMVRAYVHQHLARPTLPFGGYYALGVCQDGVAAIEKKMTGKTTLFPNTADASLFNDSRDAEINQMIAAIPKDRSGAPPQPERIFGSLPTADLAAIAIPGLTGDLVKVQAAWHDGTLRRTRPRWQRPLAFALLGVGVLLAFAVLTALRPGRAES